MNTHFGFWRHDPCFPPLLAVEASKDKSIPPRCWHLASTIKRLNTYIVLFPRFMWLRTSPALVLSLSLQLVSNSLPMVSSDPEDDLLPLGLLRFNFFARPSFDSFILSLDDVPLVFFVLSLSAPFFFFALRRRPFFSFFSVYLLQPP